MCSITIPNAEYLADAADLLKAVLVSENEEHDTLYGWQSVAAVLLCLETDDDNYALHVRMLAIALRG
jgi:hypothetical protein